MVDKSNYYDPEKGYLFNPETGMDATGRMYFAPQATADYMAKEGSLTASQPTIREKTQQAIANFLRDYGGLSNFDSYNMAEGVTGSNRPDARNLAGMGLMDFTPAGFVFSTQEAVRDFNKAETAADYIAATANLGLSAVEAFPLTKALTKPARSFLSNLGRKTSSDIVPAPEPLIASSGPTIPRRTFVQGAVATPVAGALSKLPLGKIDDVAPFAKATRLALPENFDLGSLNAFKKGIDEAKYLAKIEGREDDLLFIDELDAPEFISEANEDEILDMIAEMKYKFPESSNEEIRDQFVGLFEDSEDFMEDLFSYEDGGFLEAISKTEPKEIKVIEE
jgi:hypothetical protein